MSTICVSILSIEESKENEDKIRHYLLSDMKHVVMFTRSDCGVDKFPHYIVGRKRERKT